MGSEIAGVKMTLFFSMRGRLEKKQKFLWCWEMVEA